MTTMTPSMPATLPASRQTPPPMKPVAQLPVSTPIVRTAYVAPSTQYRKFTVDEYHAMIKAGILQDGEKVELLEGSVVVKMSKNSPHETSMSLLIELLGQIKPTGYSLRCQSPTTLLESEPEPDFSIARGSTRTFKDRHPIPSEVALVIEVSESSLSEDRGRKKRIYASESIPEYWIVNLIDLQIEVYTDPTGPDNDPTYRIRKDYPAGTSVPFTLDGNHIADIPTDDILP